jgi:succinate-semialdehyde dehydrogenase/glutarate-semialdehyde dehydrogenase
MAKMIVGGAPRAAASGALSEIHNPATDELVDTVPRGEAADGEAAVEAAVGAFPSWTQTAPARRAAILLRAAELVGEHATELATLLTREQGKPLRESSLEIARFGDILRYYAGLVGKLRGEYVTLAEPDKYGLVVRQPVGVCAAIVPWNYPVHLMGSKIAPALVAGNTVVVKPASTTPLTAIRCIELFHEATGPGDRVGETLLAHPQVRKIAFTGETTTGRHVMEVAARDIKRVTLELGGSDAMVVCDDADLDAAAAAATINRFWNAGQTCIATKRLFVFADVADDFLAQLVGRVERLKVGDGLAKDTRMGPLHTARQREEVEAMVADAVTRGARVLTGGKRPEGEEYGRGHFYLPTLLENVDPASRIAREECFGPALPIFRVSDLDEAIARANDSPYGLGSSVWTRDLARAQQAAERLEAGYTWINAVQIDYDELPFGGYKQSGYGKERGLEALEHYTESKSIVIAAPRPAVSTARKAE